MNTKEEKPSLIAFEITRRCRYSCLHCRADANANNQHELTTEQCKRILASVAKFNKCVIILTGGEPMERSDIFEITSYGRNLGLRMVMATCGYLINDETIAKLKEAGISALSFSLDGSSAKNHDRFRQTEGAFETVIRAAEIARQTKMRFQINTTITKSNLIEVSAIAKLAEDIGAYCFNPFILVPTGRGQDIASEVLEPNEYEKLLLDLLQLKQTLPTEVRVTCGPQFARVSQQAGLEANGCMGGRGFGFISYGGDVQTCGFLDISAGNIIENNFDFAKIWTQSKFLNEIRNPSAYTGSCSKCKYLRICRGCRARAYSMTGDYLASDPVCNYIGGS
jgi:radical SAM protein with 4Fe4S-binding SPASM domain